MESEHSQLSVRLGLVYSVYMCVLQEGSTFNCISN